jgi:ornithine cyclodeaminase/alanine dehydrogenase-like protein (mu-crystallin family)
MSAMQFFSKEDIRKKITMPRAIELMRGAFLQLSSGGAIVPVRTVIESRDHMGRVLYMPSYSGEFGLFGLKMVTVFDNNEALNLPVIQGRMLVMDGATGTPRAVLDAEYLTALRTGAASGLATDLLARLNAEVLALFGTGVQAETQLEGIMAVRPIREILIFGKTEKRTMAFCDNIRKKASCTIHPGTPDDLRRADIICTATTSSTPLFQYEQLKSGTHINGIGSYKPSMQELAASVITQSLLIVDQREAALSEAGDIVIPLQQGMITKDHIHAELGEIISGYKKGRTSDSQLTVFKSVGNAIQDLAIAHAMMNAGE